MKNDLEDFINKNRERFDNKVPNPAVLGRILEQMQPKEKPAEKGVVIPFRVIRWAAAAIVLLALGFAFWALQKRPDNTIAVKPIIVKPEPIKPLQQDSVKPAAPIEVAQNQPEKRKSVDDVDQDIAARKRALYASLQARNSNSAKQVVFASLSNMESPASRISAVSDANKLKNTGNDIVDALVETLNTDPSANVRLAALDGLSRFYQEKYVRKKLIASLKKQQDPLVQIALINLLTRIRESGILDELNKIVNDDNTQKPVKDCAYSGILQLHTS
jgi:hypothetical protein